jgi:hypothetical protein
MHGMQSCVCVCVYMYVMCMCMCVCICMEMWHMVRKPVYVYICDVYVCCACMHGMQSCVCEYIYIYMMCKCMCVCIFMEMWHMSRQTSNPQLHTYTCIIVYHNYSTQMDSPGRCGM